VPRGFEVADVPLKYIERPERCLPTRGGWFVEKARLFSVLEAMIAGQPLPPIQLVMSDSGTWRVQNGFHRYFASLVLEYTEIPTMRECPVRLHRCPEEESLGAAGQKLDCCILIEICADDGRQTSLEAVVVPQKRSSAARPSKKQREPQHLACRSRYEPPAVRRERLLRQEQEQKKRDLRQRASEFRRKALSREAVNQEKCDQMRRPQVSYAEKASGRLKPAEPPSWEEEPFLRVRS
jgi:hypothetical protein